MAVTEISFSPGVELPPSIYIDSNILIAFLDKNHQHHSLSARLIAEILSSDTKSYLSFLVLDEVWHILMSCWHRENRGARFDAKNKNHVKLYAALIQEKTTKLLQLLKPELLPLPHHNSTEILSKSIDNVTKNYLGPRDSFHLAYAITSEVKGFATFDGDFQDLQDSSLSFSVVRIQ